nr:hypothetical protein HK105_002809 [Polyrhizophydium stewartii]
MTPTTPASSFSTLLHVSQSEAGISVLPVPLHGEADVSTNRIEQHFKHITPTQDSPGEVPSNASSLLLALDLGRLPDVLDQALFEPSLVVRFLMDVSTKASSLYYSLRVKDQPYDVASGRMRLWDAVKEVLGHGLWLLGQLPLSEV